MPFRIVLRFEAKPGSPEVPPIPMAFLPGLDPKEGMLVAAYTIPGRSALSATIFKEKAEAQEAITRTVAYGRARGHVGWQPEAYEIEEMPE